MSEESSRARALKLELARASRYVRAHPADDAARARLQRIRDEYDVARGIDRIDALRLSSRSRRALAAVLGGDAA